MDREKLGIVGVDSGQLMICDPCYIDSEWKKEAFEDNRFYEDQRGVIVKFRKDFSSYEERLEQYNSQTPNELIMTGQWKVVEGPPAKNNFSYNATCLSSAKTYQLNYKTGHAGVAVVFQFGYGDGLYSIYGERNKEGRIVKVVIEMEEEFDAEKFRKACEKIRKKVKE